MTIAEALRRQIEELTAHRITSPHFEAEIFLSHLLQKPRAYLLSNGDQKITPRQNYKFTKMVAKRIKGWPSAYLLGRKSFYGLDFLVNKNVLIPRPETELMVDYILSGRIKNLEEALFVDLGTGSGCIIATLAHELSLSGNIKKSRDKFFVGIDISQPALRIAKQNIKLHRLSSCVRLVKGDLLSPILDDFADWLKVKKIIITANLPYLTRAQIKNSPSIKYEPKIALVAGDDGLKYYRRLFTQIQELPEEFRGCVYLFFEIDPNQLAGIKKLIVENLPGAEIKIKKDLAGLDRLVIIRIYN